MLQLHFELAGHIGDGILGLEHLSSSLPAEGIFIWWEKDGNHIPVTTADIYDTKTSFKSAKWGEQDRVVSGAMGQRENDKLKKLSLAGLL